MAHPIHPCKREIYRYEWVWLRDWVEVIGKDGRPIIGEDGHIRHKLPEWKLEAWEWETRDGKSPLWHRYYRKTIKLYKNQWDEEVENNWFYVAEQALSGYFN